MYDTGKDLLDALRAAPDVFTALLGGCTQERAQAAKGGDENWSVVEVMCHLRDAEERALERVRAMKAQDYPFLAAYDQDLWATERNYAAQQLSEALDAFLRFREQHIAELAELLPQDWERVGQHEEQGRITISDHTLHIVSHDTGHAAQIARQLGLAG